MQENKTILSLIKLKHRDNPEELELQLMAWAKYPTLKKDCRTTADFKALARDGVVKKLREAKGNIHS